MSEIRIKAEIFLSPAYGKLDSDERALFWELYAMTPSTGSVSIEQAEFNLHRRAGAASHRTIKQSIAILSRAGLVSVDGDSVEMTCPHVKISDEAARKAKSRAKVKTKPSATAALDPAAGAETAQAQALVEQPAAVTPAKKPKKEKAPKPEPEPLVYELPDYVDKALFEEYLAAYSKRTRQAVNQRKVGALIRQLAEFNELGFDIPRTIEKATIGGEKGTYLEFYGVKKILVVAPSAQPASPAALRIELPDFIPSELFHRYLEKRAAAAGRPNTQQNVDFLINQLHDLSRKGMSVRATIERATMGGPNGTYMQFFESKEAAIQTRRGGVCL